jgi:hypothetical protein
MIIFDWGCWSSAVVSWLSCNIDCWLWAVWLDIVVVVV